MSTYGEFQKKYEEEAENNFKAFMQLSEDYLLSLIQKGQYGDTYTIWKALQFKGTRKSINILFNIVSNLNNQYLIRYHACEALFKIAKINNDEFKGMVQYGRDKSGKPVNQASAIHQLRNLLSR